MLLPLLQNLTRMLGIDVAASEHPSEVSRSRLREKDAARREALESAFEGRFPAKPETAVERLEATGIVTLAPALRVAVMPADTFSIDDDDEEVLLLT